MYLELLLVNDLKFLWSLSGADQGPPVTRSRIYTGWFHNSRHISVQGNADYPNVFKYFCSQNSACSL